MSGGTLQLVPLGVAPSSIGVHFFGSSHLGANVANAPDGSGVVPMNNWMNLTPFVFANQPLTDNTGASTGASFSLVTPGTFNSGSSTQLLNGYVFWNGGTSMNLTINNIPYSAYSIYTYVGADGAGGRNTDVTIGGTDYKDLSDGTPTAYILSSSTTTYTTGDYEMQAGLTGSNQTVTLFNVAGNGGFNGFEIVNTGAASPLPTGTALKIAAGATLDLNGANATIASLSDIGAAGGTVTNSASGTPSALTISAPAGSSTFSGTIQDGAGGVSLNKTGSGMQVLSGSNSYTGKTSIIAGTLTANNATALGSGGNIVFGGGTLQYTAASAGQDWSTRFKGSTAATVALDTNGQTVVLAGAIDSSNVDGLTKLGSGTLSLAGANAYTGGTTINAGTLELDNGGNFGGGGVTDNASLVFDNNGILSVPNQIGGSGSLTQAGSGTVTLSGNNTYTGATTVNSGDLQLGKLPQVTAKTTASGNAADYDGSLGYLFTVGPNPIFVTRLGFWDAGQDGLNGSHVVRISTTAGAVVASGTVTTSSALNGQYRFVTLSVPVQLSANTTYEVWSDQYDHTKTGGDSYPRSGTNGVASGSAVDNGVAGVTFATNSLFGLDGQMPPLTGGGDPDQTVYRPVSFAFLPSLVPGTLPSTTNLTVNSGAVFDLGGGNQTIASLADGVLGGGGITNNSAAPVTLTINPAGGSTTFSGTIQNGSGALSLAKSGSGTETLDGLMTYTGSTAVSGGKLSIGLAGSISATTGVSIGAGEFNDNSATPLSTGAVSFTSTGGILSGSSALSLAVSVPSGNTLAPGNPIGTETFGSGLTVAPGATFNWENNTVNTLGVAGTNWDVANVTSGTTTISNAAGTGSKLRLFFTNAATDFTNSFWGANQIWNIITGGVAGSNTFDISNITIFINGVQQGTGNVIPGKGSFTTAAVGGNLELVWTAFVASNNSQLWVGPTQPTASLQTTSTTVSFGRVLLGSTQSTTVPLMFSGTDAATTIANVSAGADALTTTVNGPIATRSPVNAGLNTSTTGVKAGAVVISNLGAGSSGVSEGSDNGAASINVTGTVLADRTLTTPTFTGLLHVGAAFPNITVSTAAGTAGDDNHATRVTLSGGTDGTFTVAGSSTVFNSSSQTESRAVSGIFAVPGVITGSINLTTAADTSETAVGTTPQTTTANYNVGVFNGTGDWTSATNGNWGSNANWTDSNGIHAAPGTFAGFDDLDTATFDGTGAGTTITLNGVSPSLKNISFSGSLSYTVVQGTGGSLILKADAGNATISSSSTVGQTISAPVQLASDTVVSVTGGPMSMFGGVSEAGASHSLTKTGSGTLVLDNANTYTGATTVTAGTLQLGLSSATIVAKTTTGASTASTYDGSLGYLLTVGASPIFVTELGFWDANQDGLNISHTVTISTTAGVAVASGMVTTTSALDGEYRFVTLSVPVELSASTTYEIWGDHFDPGSANGGDPYPRNGTSGVDSGVTAVTFASGSIFGQNGVMPPNVTDNGADPNAIYRPVTFAFTQALSGSISSSTNLTIAASAAFDLDGNSQTLASLADSGAGGGSVINSAPSTPVTLTLNPASGNFTFSGTISDAGSANAISLVKSGSGTEVLVGNNTYSGSTTVFGGSLIVNGSLNTSGTVSITGSGILGGTGTVGNVTNSAVINPGSPGAPGTLTVAGTLTLGTGSLVLDLAASGSDSLTVTGPAVDITGATLSLNVGTINPGESFTILKVPGASGNLTGMFANLPTDGSSFPVGSVTFTISYTGGDGNDIVLTASGGSPTLVSTVRNGGIAYVNSTLAAAQHSMVESIVYSFSSAVSLSASNFSILGLPGSGTTIVPTLNVSANGTHRAPSGRSRSRAPASARRRIRSATANTASCSAASPACRIPPTTSSGSWATWTATARSTSPTSRRWSAPSCVRRPIRPTWVRMISTATTRSASATSRSSSATSCTRCRCRCRIDETGRELDGRRRPIAPSTARFGVVGLRPEGPVLPAQPAVRSETTDRRPGFADRFSWSA